MEVAHFLALLVLAVSARGAAAVARQSQSDRIAAHCHVERRIWAIIGDAIQALVCIFFDKISHALEVLLREVMSPPDECSAFRRVAIHETRIIRGSCFRSQQAYLYREHNQKTH